MGMAVVAALKQEVVPQQQQDMVDTQVVEEVGVAQVLLVVVELEELGEEEKYEFFHGRR